MPRGVFVKDILQGCEPCVEVVFRVGLKVVHVGFKGGVLLIAQKLQTLHIGNKIVELFLSDEGDDVVIEVADQGCGVPESLRDKIFEQGVSTRADEPGEHGIGLYLIASYVTRCGGVITLEDNDPCGTLFSIYIPKVKPNDSSINPIDR